jgi:hypothetical protein
MNRILHVLSLLSVMIALVQSECCQHAGRFRCCGFRRCNIFCCNCDSTYIDGQRYVCRPKETCKFSFEAAVSYVKAAVATGKVVAWAGKRSLDSTAGQKFSLVDLDGDSQISLNEAAIYLRSSLNGTTDVILSDSDIQSHFEKIDKNRNNYIDPEEFDREL